MFKVAPEQLRVSDGWVRCGQCDEVFDANAQLQTPIEPVVAPSPPPSPSSPPSNAAAAPTEYDWSDVAGMGAPAAAPAPANPVAAPATVPTQAMDSFLDQSPEALSKPLVDGNALPEFSLEAARTDTPAPAPAPAQPASARPPPSFMSHRQASTTQAGTAVRAGMWALCAVLAAALVGQVLWHERDRIATASPSLAPALASACSVLGCRIEALRRVDALVIESSSFNKALSQAYTLQFTVRNTGPVPVAMPAVELTLTDVQDRVLLRRVLPAKEFAGQKAALPAGASVAANVPVQVRPVVGAESIAGYRLLAFYP